MISALSTRFSLIFGANFWHCRRAGLMNRTLERIRLLLVANRPVVRESMRTALEGRDGIAVVAEAGSAQEAIEKAKALRPDVVLVDVNLPGLNALKAVEILRAVVPRARIVALAEHNGKEEVRRLLQAGAHSHVSKAAPLRELIRTIAKVRHAEAYFSPEARALLMDDYLDSSGRSAATRSAKLSPRERQVLACLAEGLTNKEIADRWSVSVRTIETHRERLKRKLDIHTVAGLTKYAIANGYTSLE